MYRFNYRLNLLLTSGAAYDLDLLREWLLLNAADLCRTSKIKTIFRHKKIISDSVTPDGKIRREVDLHGEFSNTYDWDGIFFNAAKSNLIQNFINDPSTNRNCSSEAIAR